MLRGGYIWGIAYFLHFDREDVPNFLFLVTQQQSDPLEEDEGIG